MTGLFSEEPTVQIQRQTTVNSNKQGVSQSRKADTSGMEQLIENLTAYSSPLMNAATELLGILVTIKRQGSSRDINRFRQKLLDAIESFRLRGLHLDYHPSVIENSCFVLCAALDEAVLYTSWGERVRWENHSLLSKVFSQRNGGEAFFILLEKASQQPKKLSDFIELQYVLLALGFKGRFCYEDEGQLHDIISHTYGLIRPYRTEIPLQAPKSPKLIEGKQPWLMYRVRKILGMTFLIFATSYGFAEYWYHISSQSLLSQLDSIVFLCVNLKNANSELVYLSTDDDLGREVIKLEENIGMKEEVVAQQWEIILATFLNPDNAVRLSNEVSQAGYKSYTRASGRGVELYVNAGDDLSEIRKLKNELNIRFGLDTMIRRAQK